MNDTPVGQLEAIWIKPAHRAPMDPVLEARLVANEGIDGNADQGGRRQVTLIEREVWDALRKELGPDVHPSARRANLLVSATPLARSTGDVLQIGECRIRIGGETTPCGRMDETCAGLREALTPDWRAGAFGVVLVGGTIAVGDPVVWTSRQRTDV